MAVRIGSFISTAFKPNSAPSIIYGDINKGKENLPGYGSFKGGIMTGEGKYTGEFMQSTGSPIPDKNKSTVPDKPTIAEVYTNAKSGWTHYSGKVINLNINAPFSTPSNTTINLEKAKLTVVGSLVTPQGTYIPKAGKVGKFLLRMAR